MAGGAGKGAELAPTPRSQPCPRPWLQSSEADFRLLTSGTARADLALFWVIGFVLICYSSNGKLIHTDSGARRPGFGPGYHCPAALDSDPGALGQVTNSASSSLSSIITGPTTSGCFGDDRSWGLWSVESRAGNLVRTVYCLSRNFLRSLGMWLADGARCPELPRPAGRLQGAHGAC